LTGGRTRFHGETSSKLKNEKFYKMVIHVMFFPKSFLCLLFMQDNTVHRVLCFWSYIANQHIYLSLGKHKVVFSKLNTRK
jgi:hypothetical protein